MNDIKSPVIRRAILDLLYEIGGELNDDEIVSLLVGLGHRRVVRRDVVEQLSWLADEAQSGGKLIVTELVGPFVVARILPEGREVAEGRLQLDGILRFKTGE